jgi:hypothetical protein
MTHTLHTHITTENFEQDDYRVYLTRDLEWTTRNHPMQKTPIELEGAWGEPNAKFDPVFMQRLCAFAKDHKFSLPPDSMWGNYYLHHQSFLDMLKQDQLESAHDLLNLMHQSVLMTGMSQGVTEFGYITRYPDTVGTMRLKRHWDVFLGFMEYCGVISPQNHEQGASYVATPLNDMLDALPANIVAPQWQGGLWSLKTNRGLFTDRDLTALYLAYKIREKMPVEASITEIGGGAGYLGYWLHVLGYRKICMVDLPSIICCQAYQLAQNIGAHEVCLPNEEYHGQAVRFLTPDQFYSNVHTTDLVVNCDSMPEMDDASLHAYLKSIAQSANYFYSINQESRGTYGPQKRMQHVVRSVLKKQYSTNYTRIDRSLFWLRNGYTEEWYSIIK